MEEFLLILGVAFVIAIIICIVIVKRELEKGKRDSLSKSTAAIRKLEEEALNEALSYDEDYTE